MSFVCHKIAFSGSHSRLGTLGFRKPIEIRDFGLHRTKYDQSSPSMDRILNCDSIGFSISGYHAILSWLFTGMALTPTIFSTNRSSNRQKNFQRGTISKWIQSLFPDLKSSFSTHYSYPYMGCVGLLGGMMSIWERDAFEIGE